jgi:16S rRNA (guanine966-N2)-methyltransferase
MRITGGELRGRQIRVPSVGVRPTQDRLREALFSILASRVPGCRFLDLYAGSGAVGLEAWSRGAACVCWVESNRRTLAVLRENAKLCTQGGRIVPDEALRALKRGLTDGPFDIIFADPPYEKGAAQNGRHDAAAPAQLILEAIATGHALAPDGVVVIEQSARSSASDVTGWTAVDERMYGETRLRIYRAGKKAENRTNEKAQGDLRGNL